MKKLEDVLNAPYGSLRIDFKYHGVMITRNPNDNKFISSMVKTVHDDLKYPLSLDEANDIKSSFDSAINLMNIVNEHILINKKNILAISNIIRQDYHDLLLNHFE
mgnify:CR=1 FL=1|tara:strand:- start:107 stop:421 length:315 start_codon:yes stop_codon:yes gene_type:complete